ncbi:MAG: ATP-binding protein [Bacillota bacterium]
MSLKKKLLCKLFPLQITKRFYFTLCILIIIMSLFFMSLLLHMFLEMEKSIRGKELYDKTVHLEKNIQGSFEDILKRHDALNKPVEEQVSILNSELQPVVDRCTARDIKMCMGYYSLEHDRVLAIGPDFNPSFLKEKLSDDLSVYKTGQPELFYYKYSIIKGKPALYQTYPINRDGKIIGYTWAGVTADEVYAGALKGAIYMLVVIITTTCIVLYISWLFFRRIKMELENFSNAVIHGDTTIPQDLKLPELRGILEKIHQNDELVRVNAELEKEIRERRKIEKALRFSEERFSKAFTASPAPMAISTFDRGKYVAVNKSFSEYTGYSRDEIIGREAREMGFWADANERERVLRLLSSQGRARNIEFKYRRKSGQCGVGLLSAETINISGIDLLLSIIIDITELKQMESELARLDRLNLIGQMAAGIGHEVRNPMTTTRGFLQVLSGKEELKQFRDYFKLMIEEMDRANAIITEFLSLTKSTPSGMVVQSLNSIIESLSPLLTADAMNSRKDIELHLEKTPDIPLNEKEIRQLILNLVRNGLEAMTEGGTLTVRTYTGDNEVVMSVQDQGAGIDPENIDKLGIPFFTTKDYGTGLGLAVCNGIAARHNAAINIDTGENGTTFFIRFKTIGSN